MIKTKAYDGKTKKHYEVVGGELTAPHYILDCPECARSFESARKRRFCCIQCKSRFHTRKYRSTKKLKTREKRAAEKRQDALMRANAIGASATSDKTLVLL